jgi:hypothetical protein
VTGRRATNHVKVEWIGIASGAATIRGIICITYLLLPRRTYRFDARHALRFRNVIKRSVHPQAYVIGLWISRTTFADAVSTKNLSGHGVLRLLHSIFINALDNQLTFAVRSAL